MGSKTSLFYNRQSGGRFAIEDQGLNTGNRWFVDSGSANAGNAAGKGMSPSAPFSSLTYAFSSDRVQANNGDIVYVMPGHAEAVASDGALTIDIAGVEVWGLGRGDNRPLITISTAAAAAALITGAGTIMHGFRWSIAIDAATDPIQISGAGGDFYDWEIIEASACEALDLLSVSTGGTRTKIHDMVIKGRNTTDGDALNAIHLDGCDDVEIYNIHAYNGDWKEGVIFNQGDEVLDIKIHDCILQTKATEDLSIVLDTNATGEIYNLKCILFENAANIDECLSIGKCHAYDPILVVNADGEKGIEWPGTDSTDA